MRITHITLTGLYTDSWLYQDNILPKYHKRFGNEVNIITSHFIYNEKGNIDYDKRNDYINEFGIRVQRLETKFKAKAVSKFKIYRNLYETIALNDPEIIFIHGCQFLDISTIIRYKENNPNAIIYVDNHADFSNSATNWVSKNILHKIIWKHFAKKIEPFVTKFYGVLPSRVDFLVDLYKIPKDKVELLVLGADDDLVNSAREESTYEEIRNKLNVSSDEFLIITGGKIDRAKKQTLLLMSAIRRIKYAKVKLVIFGSVEKELQHEFNSLLDSPQINYVGWISPNETYKYLAAADLAVFPGRHSVIWEQAVGLGIPLIIKRWDGTTHVDVGGNCKYLENDSEDEIYEKIETLLSNRREYLDMKQVSLEKGLKKFSYSYIAKKSIGLD